MRHFGSRIGKLVNSLNSHGCGNTAANTQPSSQFSVGFPAARSMNTSHDHMWKDEAAQDLRSNFGNLVDASFRMDCFEWKRSGFVMSALQHEQGARDEPPSCCCDWNRKSGSSTVHTYSRLVEWAAHSSYVTAMITVDSFERYCGPDAEDSKANSRNITGVKWDG